MKKRMGQLYKIPIREEPPDGHNPEGDMVYPLKGQPNANVPIGFIVRRCANEHKFMIMLAYPCAMAPEAEVVLYVGDIVQTLREEAFFCALTKTKLTDAAQRFPALPWLQCAVNG